MPDKHDLVVLACRPRDLDMSNPDEALIAGMTFVYDGSAQGFCDTCRRVIWVGPNQLRHIAVTPEVMVVCFICASLLAGTAEMDIRSLGNQQRRPT